MSVPPKNQIGLAHAGALLGHDARNEFADSPRRVVDPDFRKRLLENLGVESLLIGARGAVDDELGFFLRGALAGFPVGFPIRWRLPSEESGRARSAKSTKP